MEEEIVKVKTKCRGCGAILTIVAFKGECTKHLIVGCDKCSKIIKEERDE